jgi:hypothetical protein
VPEAGRSPRLCPNALPLQTLADRVGEILLFCQSSVRLQLSLCHNRRSIWC